MKERTVIVTGANSGIGRATARGLAEMGAHVVMVARSQKKGQRAQDDIRRRTGNERVDLLIADLSTRDAIRELASEIHARYRRIDVLINNAAVLTSKRRTTPEGFEMQFFVNHLAYFMLTGLLFGRLRESAPSRVVNMASTAHSRGTINFDDIQCEHGYKGWQVYANTKLMNVVFTYELARRVAGTGVTANCVHPGVIHTNLLRNFNAVLNVLFHTLQAFFKKPEDGAETPIFLASSPDVLNVSGKYFRYCAPVGTSQESNDPSVAQRLWELSEDLAECPFPIPAAD